LSTFFIKGHHHDTTALPGEGWSMSIMIGIGISPSLNTGGGVPESMIIDGLLMFVVRDDDTNEILRDDNTNEPLYDQVAS
jgi:hypothetical protein